MVHKTPNTGFSFARSNAKGETMTMQDLSGELGGALAAAWATGAVSAWAFAWAIWRERIAEIKMHFAEHKAECSAEVADLREYIAELQQFALHGEVRQLAQIQVSGRRLDQKRRTTSENEKGNDRRADKA